jgi:hypothetical protein
VILPRRPVPEVVSLPLDNSDRLSLYSTKGSGYRGMYEICFAYGRKEMVIKRTERKGHFDTKERVRNDAQQDVALG